MSPAVTLFLPQRVTNDRDQPVQQSMASIPMFYHAFALKNVVNVLPATTSHSDPATENIKMVPLVTSIRRKFLATECPPEVTGPFQQPPKPFKPSRHAD
ncbi:hypothetical protein EIP91_005145, partial [Steccherinum ochraceum]